MLQLRAQDSHNLRATLACFPEVRRACAWLPRCRPGATRWRDLFAALEQVPIIYRLDLIHLDAFDDPGSKQSILLNRRLL